MLNRLQNALQGSVVSQIVLSLGFTYLLITFARWLALFYRRASIMRDHECKPAKWYPHTDPIFGLDLFIENVKLSRNGGFVDAVRSRFERLECGTFQQLMMGRALIHTCEAENIKAILAAQFKDFNLTTTRKAAFEPIFGHGIFTTDGPEWEASRALLRPSFTRSQVGDIATFEVHVKKLLARIPRDGSTVDLQDLFFELTLDSATEFLFGHSTNVLDKSDPNGKRGEQFGEAFGAITERVGIEGRAGVLTKLIPYTAGRNYTDDKNFIHHYVSEYVQKAVQLNRQSPKKEKSDLDSSQSDKYVFLEHLAKTGYSEKKIQDELLNILLAGRDTTAGMLSYLFYYLARNQRVWNKLRAEVLALGDETPSFEQIKSLKYMQWVLNEILRLHPIVPANGRVAVRDTTIPVGGGPDGKSPIFVKKGQMVVYHVYTMHRRKDIYGENSDEFFPERWESLRPGWQYLPFNGGPRICIGQQFALTEASYCIVRILQTFKAIEKRDDSLLSERITVTVSVRPGTLVGLTPA